jgi:hypothetical protein
MLTALVAFLSGGVARMIFGELMALVNKRIEHSQEMDRMKLQGELDDKQHARNMESIKTQNDLGVKTIRVQSEAVIGEIEARGWLATVEGSTKKIGIDWVDAWNAVIRPAVATWAIFMISGEAFGFWKLSEPTLGICGAALGIYLATRDLFKRGK